MRKKLLTLGALLATLAVSAQTSTLQVIHNSADPLANLVDIYVNGQLFSDDFEFRKASSVTTVPSNTLLNIGIAPGNSISVADTLKNFPFTLEDGKHYVLIANGEVLGLNERALKILAFDQGRIDASSGGTDLLVFHGSVDAPGVDITLENGNLLSDPGTSNVQLGDFRGYVNLPVNNYSIQVRVAGTENVVKGYEVPLSTLGTEGMALTVFASGYLNPSNNQPSFGLFAATKSGEVISLPVSMAKIQIVHNSANAGDVDIYLNKDTKLSDVGFRTATGYIEVEAGVNNSVDIALAGSSIADDAPLNYNVSFAANSVNQIFANGLLGAEGASAFDLYLIDDAKLTAESGVDLKVFHGVTDAPAVDVTLEDGTVLFGDLSYTNATEYLNLDENDYSIQVRVPGTNTVVKAYEAVLKTLGLEGNAITVFASGLLGATGDEPKFGLFAVTAAGDVVALPVSMAKIQIVHNSPDAGSVDIYLNKDTKLSDVGFRSATGYIDVEAGVNNAVDIALAGSASADDAVFNYAVPFAANTNYTIFANGLVANVGQANGFDLLAIENTKCDAAVNTTDVIVLHVSPNAPAVNVTLDNGNLLDASTENVSYNEFTQYLSLPTNDYKLQVRLNADNSVFQAYDAPLQTLALNEKSIIVFASGLVGTTGDTEFGLYALDCEGNVTALPVSDPTSVNLIKDWGVVYSNPIQNSLRLEVNTDVNYSIFDLSGRLVNNGFINGGVNTISTSNLKAGTYVVQLTNNKEVLNFKVVKN
jgi:hypothetical protein